MNSTELSLEFQSAVAWAHHICGSTLAIFNAFVCLLILLDTDPRGKSYRKYLFPLQFFSTLADLFMDWYSPYFQLNALLIYSNSSMATFLDIPAAFMIYLSLFGYVCSSYFCCVFYRQRAILPHGSLFCYNDWKFVAVIAIQQANLLIALGFLYYYVTRFASSSPPNILSWVQYKAAYVFFTDMRLSYVAAIYSSLSALAIIIIIIGMVVLLTVEIKHGMAKASAATKRYQSRAVSSLIMQGTIPSLFYVVPVPCEVTLGVYGIVVGAEAGARISMLSVIAVNVLSLHAFAHSLTILAFSPSYRKSIQTFVGSMFSTIRQVVSGKSSSAQIVVVYGAKRSITFVNKNSK
ncbi:hypothetical protein PRIPAC_77156 [Pristionchus pacificus]|uniref:G protein-coupled receptor n=1 Tax=Pristionchus pacificus TaxID=54126 RepID=A0A2A6CPD6_PRIPA|nr:hypothetical protein PRIPAC_77156 [Pristionchus pacificus]|eukprot:PDM80062.1 G protein-coupled receptor [Pristionchus pacificus]